MRIGVIDIGSNSIKGFVYHFADGKIEYIDNKYIYAYLMSYVKEDSLSDEGISVLASSVSELKLYLNKMNCSMIYAFATSAMRDAKNADAIIDKIRTESGIKIDLLTEEQEAYYDYLSLRYFSDTENGVGLDLGGGSGQIFTFSENELKQSISLPIGVLRTKNKFVSRDFPKADEYVGMTEHIQGILEKAELFRGQRYDHLMIMGGTAVTLFDILKALKLVAYQNNGTKIAFDNLAKAKAALIDMGEIRYDFLHEHANGREYTTLPGITILQAIGEYFDIDTIGIYSCGVREGYLLAKAESDLHFS